MKNFDQTYSDKIFFATKSSPMLSTLAKFFATFVLWLCLAAVVLFVFFSSLKNGAVASWNLLFLLETGVVMRVFVPWVVTITMSLILRRKRPFRAEHHKPLIHMPIETPSFPSAHATIAFAFSTLFLYDPALFAIAIVMAICVALSRVAVGVHYLSDILAGSVVGLIFGILVFRFLPIIIGG